MKNNAYGQVVLDTRKGVSFEHRREEAHPLPTSNRTANSAWKGIIGKKLAVSSVGIWERVGGWACPLPNGAINGLTEQEQAAAPTKYRTLKERLVSFWGINRAKSGNQSNPVIAVLCFTGCAIGIGLMAMVALLTHSPFIFPSLGPTAFLFFSNPTAPAASPRNTIIGHIIGVLAGYFSIVVTGLTMAGPALQVGVTIPRIIAVALSLSLTAGLMILFRAAHPPAGATTLMVSLGILPKPWQLEVIIVAVVLLTLFAVLFNRLVGVPYPLWKTISHKASSKVTIESSLSACIIETSGGGTGRGEESSDSNWRSNRQFSKRECLSRIKRTHVKLIPLKAG